MGDGVIDYLCNPFWPGGVDASPDHPEVLAAVEPSQFVRTLDEAGVDTVLVPSIQTWDYRRQRPLTSAPWRGVADISGRYPRRVFGLYGVNPLLAMQGVAELEEAVRDFKFKGAHIHPHGFGIPPSHAHYFPFLAKCAELGVPVVVSMGHTLDPSPIEFARPFYLDDIALYFPNLRIVLAHTGWPWVEEAIALTSKHPNMFLGTSAHGPKYWKPEMVQFLNSRRGRDKVLFGTDWPLLKHADALAQIEALGLKEESVASLTRLNAKRVFDLD